MATRPKRYADNPVTIGEHLLKHRVAAGFLQRDMTNALDVCIHTYIDWEKDRAIPPTRYFPKIIKLLGYIPCPAPITLPEKLLYLRRTNGWKIIEAATHIGVDEGTWGRWEQGQWPIHKRHQQLLVSLKIELTR